MNWRRYVFLIGTLIFAAACKDFGKMKFDKAKWNEDHEIGFPQPSRNKMLSDLVENHKLTGMKYNEVTSMLGQPNTHDSLSFSYDIIEDYGFDIDPVHTKYLEFEFSNDSVITAYRIEEWEKGKEKK